MNRARLAAGAALGQTAAPDRGGSDDISHMVQCNSNWSGVAFGLLVAAFAAYQQFKLPPALPLMLERYAYDRTLAGAFMSVYALAGLVLSFALGHWIERGGARRPIALALGLMAVGVAVTLAVPQSGLVVLGARGLEGVGFAILAIAGPVLANANASRRHLPLVIALTAAWIPIGQLAAVLLAQPSFVLIGWQGLWWLALVMTAGLAIAVARLPSARGLDPAAPRHASRPARGDAGNVSRAERLSLALAAAVFMLWSGQYFAYMTWLPQYLVEALGLSMAGAIAGYTLPVAVLLVAILGTGQVLRRGVPVGRLLVAGLALQAVTWVLLPLAASGLPGALALVLYGAGAGIVPTCLFAMPSALAAHGHAAATAFGTIMTGRNLGVLAGPVGLAQVFALTGSWSLTAPLLGGVTAIALVLGIWLARRLAGAAYGTSR